MNNIFDFYRTECDESERLSSQAGKVEFLTTMNYIKKVSAKGCKILDACAGTGIYAFPLAECGYEVTAGDLIDVNVEKIEKQQMQTSILKEVYKGSILDLSLFEDEHFDVVLNLGAYYHMCNGEERMNAIKESLRVLKKDGIYVMAYINKYANYISHCTEMENDFGFFERYLENGHIDNNYVFYSSTPEAVEKEIQTFNLSQLYNIATDGPIFIYRNSVDEMSYENFERFLNVHLKTCEVRSILGYSEHGLYIGRK